MNTSIEIWLTVAAGGGQLGISGDRLRMLLPTNCPPELKDCIRQHKNQLLKLVQANFLVVSSDILDATSFFWTPDDATKQLLISSGADRGTKQHLHESRAWSALFSTGLQLKKCS